MLIVDRLVIHPGDDVVKLDPATVGRRSRRDVGDQGADHQAVGGGGRLIELLVGDAEEWPVDMAGRDQLRGNVARGIAVERKAQAGAGLGLFDGEVDADHLAGGVEQGSAAVARVDLGVGLDRVEDVFGVPGRWIGNLDGPVDGADHALGHAVLLAEGAADGDRELADLQAVRLAPIERRQILRLDLDHRYIVVRAGTDHPRVVGLVLIAQDHLQLLGVLDHVVVGDDVAVRPNDEARADAMLLLLHELVGRRHRGLDLNDGTAGLARHVDHRGLFGEVVVDRPERRHNGITGGCHLDEARGEQHGDGSADQRPDQRAEDDDRDRLHPSPRLDRDWRRHRRKRW